MHEQSPTATSRLTDVQRAQIDYARRDLEAFRAEDLTQLQAAALILMVERLRTRLHDILALINEITTPATRQSTHPHD
ncbi:hypothetical protein [Streptomyces sp. LN704]|uniref:hypothetical protein n=1 Tax=Streptomyces sp. LN704 TaxID=3112982 RepID=UPI0037157E48